MKSAKMRAAEASAGYGVLSIPAMISYSLLDLAPIPQGSDAATTFRHALDLAQHAEHWGYHRYWLAEHHNMPGIASAATAVLIGHVAGGTSHIRVGSGGIMLPNHAPLVIAEQFGTLESLYPGRIDLGLGRAPGGDQPTSAALRRSLGQSGDTFPQDLAELLAYFEEPMPTQRVRAVPGAGLRVPIYLLGSSDFSARLAAELGLPFAFASHFAPAYLRRALEIYRANFRPSARLSQPYVMLGMNIFAAETDAQASRLFTSLEQQFVNLIRGRPSQMPPPVDTMDDLWTPLEAEHAMRMISFSAVGSPDTIREQLARVLALTEADEIVATAQIYDHDARLRSFELASTVLQEFVRKPEPARA